MARPSNAAQRSLTLTEELEKLEQSITLTLQEIDHNFSRAHRIVTSSILPVVEKYAEHSREVWEGSKFWKQFFEASANVSLNGYEEVPEEDDELEDVSGTRAGEDEEDETIVTNDGEGDEALLSESTPVSRTGTSSFMETPAPDGQHEYSQQAAETPGSKTPRAAVGTTPKRRVHRQNPASPTPSGSVAPSTPRAQTMFDESTLSSTTPDLPSMAHQDTASASRRKHPSSSRSRPDAMLHRGVLDRNYRVQATPLGRSGGGTGGLGHRYKPETPVSSNRASARLLDELDSSPMEEAPSLHPGLLSTHAGGLNARRRVSGHKAEWESQRARERVPGVSILSNSEKDGGKRRDSLRKAARESIGAAAAASGSTAFGLGGSSAQRRDGSSGGVGGGGGSGWIDSDDEDAFGGMSPPKTMAFNVPTSKLLRTPAREASKMIVQDLLATAGGDHMSDGLDDEENSPSIVRRGINYEEDTF